MKCIGEDIKTAQFGWHLGMPLVKRLENEYLFQSYDLSILELKVNMIYKKEYLFP
jgi:hypothetical protein